MWMRFKTNNWKAGWTCWKFVNVEPFKFCLIDLALVLDATFKASRLAESVADLVYRMQELSKY